jgi:hypothetical protein
VEQINVWLLLRKLLFIEGELNSSTVHGKTLQGRNNKNDDVLAVSFNYIQHVQRPRIPALDLFFLGHLSVYLLCVCVHEVKADQLVIKLHHKGSANKRPDEVCSLLCHYILHCASTSTNGPNLFRDNCPGHKKKYTVMMFLQALTKSNKFKKIHHFSPHQGIPVSLATGISEFVTRKLTDGVYTAPNYTEMILLVQVPQRSYFMGRILQISNNGSHFCTQGTVSE